MATGFDVDTFLSNPSYESLVSCKRNELLVLAARFQVNHLKHIFKRDLQELVLEELEDRGLVTRQAREVAVGKVEEGRNHLEILSACEAENALQTPVTLPKYEPFQ